MDKKTLTKIARAKVLSKAWYGAPVWLSNRTLKKAEIKLLDSAVGNLLRNIMKDYEKKYNRDELHKILQVPKSIKWGNYMTVSFGNRICMNTTPEDLFIDFILHAKTSKETSRIQTTKLFPSNSLKSGYNMLVNRLADILSNSNFDITTYSTKNSRKKIFL